MTSFTIRIDFSFAVERQRTSREGFDKSFVFSAWSHMRRQRCRSRAIPLLRSSRVSFRSCRQVLELFNRGFEHGAAFHQVGHLVLRRGMWLKTHLDSASRLKEDGV